MKRFIFFISLFFLSQKIDAQILFCPAGAEWHYSFSGYNFSGPPLFQNEKIKYIKDTLIGNDLAKVLSHKRYYDQCNFPPIAITYIKQKGDTIFMKSAATQSSWQILYNFAATAGQSWITTINTSYTPSITLTHTVSVDSVKFTTVNNFVLKTLYVKYKFPGNTISEIDTIKERLGCNVFMFHYGNPSNWSDCDRAHGIICYQDSVFGLKQFTNYACDYQDYVGIPENNYQNSSIKISPNPADDFFIINTENEILSGGSIVSINDLSGRTIKQIKLATLSSEKIDIADLANGVYILNITHDGTPVYTGKLVKVE